MDATAAHFLFKQLLPAIIVIFIMGYISNKKIKTGQEDKNGDLE